MGFGVRDRVGVNIKWDFNSDVDVAVVTHGVSVFHIKQPHFVSNDSPRIRMEKEDEKERKGRINVQHFQHKLP